MKEIKLKGLDISCYTEKLKNGLEVILVPYSDKKNYFISYATRFGSEVTKFMPVDSKEEVSVPYGIAHFLEHKMFEQEDGIDPFSYFSESGTGSNASTSFTSTQYICYGTKNFEDNLKYLISFVNSPYYTFENVEKEKGIIAEELKMYDDIPEFKLDNKLRENVYHVHPRRVDIGGTIPEINKITKDDLYLCYNNFYQPNNMFILVVGNFDKDKTIEIIREKLGKVKSKALPIVKEYKEKKTVNKKYEEIDLDINLPKVGLGLKIYSPDLKIDDDLKLDLYLEMITGIAFGTSSEFREEVRSKKILNSIYMEWETAGDFRTFLLSASTPDADMLITEIKNKLLNLDLSEADFSRMKKVWIANEVKMIDYVDATVRNIYDDMIRYRKVIGNKIDIIRKMSFKELQDIISRIDFSNIAVVKMLPKNKKD